MSDAIRDLQSKLRSSQDPISTFYLIQSRAGAERMLEKVRLLAGKGVAEDDIASIAQLVTDVLRHGDHNLNFRRQFAFSFHRDGTGEPLPGFVDILNLPGQGYEVELIMPGIVASSMPEFFDNGFWTAFMPPAFYD